jgi:hypothetical protein
MQLRYCDPLKAMLRVAVFVGADNKRTRASAASQIERRPPACLASWWPKVRRRYAGASLSRIFWRSERAAIVPTLREACETGQRGLSFCCPCWPIRWWLTPGRRYATLRILPTSCRHQFCTELPVLSGSRAVTQRVVRATAFEEASWCRFWRHCPLRVDAWVVVAAVSWELRVAFHTATHHSQGYQQPDYHFWHCRHPHDDDSMSERTPRLSPPL